MQEVSLLTPFLPFERLVGSLELTPSLGNIPRFVTNSSLPSNVAEDVPSFLAWIEKKFPEPEGGAIGSEQAP